MMTRNGQPMVPLSALERCQGELKTAYCTAPGCNCREWLAAAIGALAGGSETGPK